jgi:CMP/dCMP kinase
MIIAIDGPAGSGKSSTAKMVAFELNFLHLDTGAMYRAITLKCLGKKIAVSDVNALSRIMETTSISFTGNVPDMQVWMDGENVSESIRSDTVTKNVSDYCAVPLVRDNLVDMQRAIARDRSVVCEGRDIGTVVFPNAELKFFLTASIEERARRRQSDFKRMGIQKEIDDLIAEISERDRKDSTRQHSPLRKAKDAREIDTTDMALSDQVRCIVEAARSFPDLVLYKKIEKTVS